MKETMSKVQQEGGSSTKDHKEHEQNAEIWDQVEPELERVMEEAKQAQVIRYTRALESMGKPMDFSWNAILEASQESIGDMDIEVAKNVALKCAIADPKSFLKELEAHKDPRLAALLPDMLAAYQIKGMETEIGNVMTMTQDRWRQEILKSQMVDDSGSENNQSETQADDKEAMSEAKSVGDKLTDLVVNHRVKERLVEKLRVMRLKRRKSQHHGQVDPRGDDHECLRELRWIDKFITNKGNCDEQGHTASDERTGEHGEPNATSLNRRELDRHTRRVDKTIREKDDDNPGYWDSQTIN